MKLFPGFLVSIPDRLFDWKRISLSLFLFSCRHTHRFPAGKIKICYDIRKSFIMALESSGLKVLLTTEPRGGFHFSLSSSLDQGTPLRKGKEKVLFPFARFGSAHILQSVLPGRLLSMSPAPVLHILAFNLFHSIKFDYIRLLIAWHTHTHTECDDEYNLCSRLLCERWNKKKGRESRICWQMCVWCSWNVSEKRQDLRSSREVGSSNELVYGSVIFHTFFLRFGRLNSLANTAYVGQRQRKSKVQHHQHLLTQNKKGARRNEGGGWGS